MRGRASYGSRSTVAIAAREAVVLLSLVDLLRIAQHRLTPQTQSVGSPHSQAA